MLNNTECAFPCGWCDDSSGCWPEVFIHGRHKIAIKIIVAVGSRISMLFKISSMIIYLYFCLQVWKLAVGNWSESNIATFLMIRENNYIIRSIYLILFHC